MKRITNKMGYVLIIIALIAMTAANATGQVPPVEVYTTDSVGTCVQEGLYMIPFVGHTDTCVVMVGQDLPDNAKFLKPQTPRVWVSETNISGMCIKMLCTNALEVYIACLTEYEGEEFLSFHYTKYDFGTAAAPLFKEECKIIKILILPPHIGVELLGMYQEAEGIHIR